MLKALGGICILATGFLWGYEKVWTWKRKQQVLNTLEDFLGTIIRGVSIQNDTLEHILQQKKEEMTPVWKEALEEALEERNQMPLQEALLEKIVGICKAADIEDEICKLCRALFDKGIGNKAMFLKRLYETKEAIAKEKEAYSKKCREQAKLSVSLGTLGGVFVLLILI